MGNLMTRCGASFHTGAVLAFVSIIVVLSQSLMAQSKEEPKQGRTTPAPTAASAPVTPARFVHPGIYYNTNDLAFMRQKLQAKAEPWFSAWEKNKPGAKEEAWAPHPQAEWDATKDLYMGGDPVVAHKEALQWALTGNPAHAAKAIEILNAWSSKLQTIVPHKMPQEKLGCGVNAHHFANAAELLCYGGPDGKASGWAPDDIQRFKKMLGLFYKVIEDFQSHYNGNWDAIMMNSMMCMGVFLDDQAMFDRAAKHYVVGEPSNGGLTNYIRPSGQCQESYRDMGHVQWGLGAFVALCEVAWKQGVDLYGKADNRLLVGLEYSAKYNLGEEVPYEGPGTICKRGLYAPIWETAYQHYVYRKGLDMPYTKRIIYGTDLPVNGKNKSQPGSYRPEGGFSVGISWGTFTMFKGEDDPQAAKNVTTRPSGARP